VVPLIYGQNIWDCWNPPGVVRWSAHQTRPSPGSASRTTRGERQHGLAFFRFDWEAAAKTDPVTAFSIVSHMRAPAPMIMAVEVLPATSTTGQ
jgi:hypothetical protein